MDILLVISSAILLITAGKECRTGRSFLTKCIIEAVNQILSSSGIITSHIIGTADKKTIYYTPLIVIL